jgi:hypothetical protein
MPRREPLIFRALNGFIPTQQDLAGVPDSLIDGQNLLVFGNGLIKSARGPSAGGTSGAPRPAMNVKSTFGGVSSYGTLLSWYNVYLAGGSGTVTLTGSSLGSVSDALAINTGSGLVLAGVPTPGAPTVSTTPPTAGSLVGAYSLALTAVRVLGNVTGESSRGTPSATVYFSNKKMRVTAWPSTPSGCDATRDKWGLYLCFRGFPTQGPWRHLIDIPMNTGLPYDFDFLDGQLGHLAPLDHDLPPACKFLFTLDNVVTIIGPGGQLNPSVPLQPDAFPPDQAVFLARGEDATSCRGSGASGRVAIACANSLHEVFSSGSDDISPIIAIPRWPSVGFIGSSSWGFFGDIIIGMSSVGPVMGTLDGQPDNSFATDMIPYFDENGWDSSNTVLGIDPKTESAIFIKGAVGFPFSFATRKWSPKYVFPGNVSTAVTVGSQLQVDIGGTMYIYEGGAASPPSFDATFAWQDAGSEFLKTLVRVRAAGDTQLTIQPLTDLSLTPVVSSFTSDPQHGNPKRLNLRQWTSLTFKISGTGARKTVKPLRARCIEHKVTNHK